MDLTTSFAGLSLKTPIMVGASPLGEDLDAARAAEDAGASAFVMHSLFMEQVVADQLEHARMDFHRDAFAEAASFLPETPGWSDGPDEYLEQLGRLQAVLEIPVFASLNGTQGGRWVEHARMCQQAGASAIELNVYHLPLDGRESSGDVESRLLGVLSEVVATVEVPVVMKLLPLLSSPVHFARRAADSGAAALVLFNRLFHPDLDIEGLEVDSSLSLSPPGLLGERLLWLAACCDQVPCSLGATGGVRDARDVVKALMAGADAVQVVSTLLREGPGHVAVLLEGLSAWMEEHEYASVEQLVGALSLGRCPRPERYHRANYMKLLRSWGM